MKFVENLLQQIKKHTKRVRITVEETGDKAEARKAEEIQVSRTISEEEVEVIYENEEDAIIREEIEAIIQKNVMDKDLESTNEEDVDFTNEEEVDAIDEEEIRMINLVEVIKAMEKSFTRGNMCKKKDPYIPYYLDSVGTSNEGLNTLANIGITTTARAPDTTSTSWAAHMATIIANPCPISAIPHNGALNTKVIDKLILKHLDERFIKNLGVSCHDRKQNYIERQTYTEYHSFDFVESNLKSVENYTKALQIVYNQRPMQEYLFNNAIPMVADWPGQFFIRKAIAH
ncbi:hypothetical protein C2G38_2194739 [Gigaspora rosea]|uniref:Uncharacterized protein n=1 Tax=Gigaspora rosea TaxID=44941 RepID=A0A397UWF6_9GLOM|nr:hypothetical protein C2G38_2194739 [Gigaspora rosea]